MAGLIDPRYGAPDVGETRAVIDAAKKLKNDLLSGKNQNLQMEEKKTRKLPNICGEYSQRIMGE